MAIENIIVQQPSTPAAQLILLFHGVGDNPVSMGEIGKLFAASFPDVLVVSLGSPDICDFGRGFQWFSVQGVNEKNRQSRIDQAMPLFISSVRQWQQDSGISVQNTILIGFSQGTIMALESTKVEGNLAGRIVAFSGRFATLPENPIAARTVVHLIHGEQDPVINPYQSKIAAERLKALGNTCTLELQSNLAHGINAEAIAIALRHLHQ